jgi:hypothetical protein
MANYYKKYLKYKMKYLSLKDLTGGACHKCGKEKCDCNIQLPPLPKILLSPAQRQQIHDIEQKIKNMNYDELILELNRIPGDNTASRIIIQQKLNELQKQAQLEYSDLYNSSETPFDWDDVQLNNLFDTALKNPSDPKLKTNIEENIADIKKKILALPQVIEFLNHIRTESEKYKQQLNKYNIQELYDVFKQIRNNRGLYYKLKEQQLVLEKLLSLIMPSAPVQPPAARP